MGQPSRYGNDEKMMVALPRDGGRSLWFPHVFWRYCSSVTRKLWERFIMRKMRELVGQVICFVKLFWLCVLLDGCSFPLVSLNNSIITRQGIAFDRIAWGRFSFSLSLKEKLKVFSDLLPKYHDRVIVQHWRLWRSRQEQSASRPQFVDLHPVAFPTHPCDVVEVALTSGTRSCPVACPALWPCPPLWPC